MNLVFSFHYEKGQHEQSQSYQQMSKEVSLWTPYGHSELLVFQGKQKLQLSDNLLVDFCSASDTAEVHESSESVASSHTKVGCLLFDFKFVEHSPLCHY